MTDLEGKVALITGSSRGIGKATAVRLAKLGAVCVVTGRKQDAVKKVGNEIRSLGGKCFEQQVDFNDKTQIEALIERLLYRYEGIDILVNNVGGSSPPLSLDELSEEIWHSQIRINLTSVFLCTKGIIKRMKERQWGRIINIASVAGRSYSQLGGVPYAVAKHGVVGFTRQLAKEVASYSITVNCVAPGLVGTERILSKWESLSREDQDNIHEKILVGRLGEPREVACVVSFLASEDSSYITGATIDVNGGMLMV